MGDRAGITMTSPFMDAYVKLLIQTCHRRGVHAMGGMSGWLHRSGLDFVNMWIRYGSTYPNQGR